MVVVWEGESGGGKNNKNQPTTSEAAVNKARIPGILGRWTDRVYLSFCSSVRLSVRPGFAQKTMIF